MGVVGGGVEEAGVGHRARVEAGDSLGLGFARGTVMNETSQPLITFNDSIRARDIDG